MAVAKYVKQTMSTAELQRLIQKYEGLFKELGLGSWREGRPEKPNPEKPAVEFGTGGKWYIWARKIGPNKWHVTSRYFRK